MMQRRRFSLLLLTLLLGLTGPVRADALDDAKRDGLVGEQANGYLGVVEAPGSAAIRALVEGINARRRERYLGIAADNGIDLEAVELLAGQKAIEKTPPGQFIRLATGPWRRK
ncbi:MAG: YdbL family protein [Pseudomonadales bacterium]|jgi:uncharacterized protein YdbL (DUF1318 family)|nr:YdbL family protein [Pseudomonadales bacterium]